MADDGVERNGRSGDRKKGSRKRADEAAERGNYRHPRYRGGLSREAMNALERGKHELIEKEKNDISGNSKQ